MSISKEITQRLKAAGRRFNANDNISDMIRDGELAQLQEELTDRFTDVLKTLVIDIENDPNSRETGHRLAKMYVNELMEGRFYPAPKVTAFPNEKNGSKVDLERLTPVSENDAARPAYSYTGLLVVPAEITSMCSHHHQMVKGIMYIGVIPGEYVLGLSKYVRIAQFMAKRGTLQEQLTEDVLHAVQEASKTEDVAVMNISTHGCMTCRGVGATAAFTGTAELGGAFMTDLPLRDEFYKHVQFLEDRRPKVG